MTAIGAFQALVEFRYILLEVKMILSRSLKIVANGVSWRRTHTGFFKLQQLRVHRTGTGAALFQGSAGACCWGSHNSPMW